MYIQLLSLHGLIRGQNVEMGRDADTGGQVRYVLELAQALARRDDVQQVDLITRRLRDRRISADYAAHIEPLCDKCRIVRLPAGGGKYVRKERLWPFLDEFVDQLVAFTRRQGRLPHFVHGHYADAGYVAREAASVFNVPFIFTGHSLGKPKLNYLLEEGWTREEAAKELAIDTRIQVEQDCLLAADLVVTSTRHERDTQYAEYHKDPALPFAVIAPGTNLDRFFPYYQYDLAAHEIPEQFKQARVRMVNKLSRFFFHADRPLILALCRPDRRKNIQALIKAYGESQVLPSIANLAVFAGIREDIETMPDNERQVLTDMLLLMDRYDLYGKMAVPKQHDSEFEVPELYRLAAASRGVFVNPAFIELFGLTAIESSATGLPFVATKNGGPSDIAELCRSGMVVDVNNQQELTQALIQLLTSQSDWDQASSNGVNQVREHYSWDAHVETFLEHVSTLTARHDASRKAAGKETFVSRLATVEAILITDIDNTLLGDDESFAELISMLRAHRSRLAFGVASGRSLELIHEVLAGTGIDDIDVIIGSVGCEIYYGKEARPDKGWARQLRDKWYPDRIRKALDALPFLRLQSEPFTQREFKISYHLDNNLPSEETLPLIHQAINGTRSAYSLIFSHGAFVDVLPHRASKGKAVRFLSQKWNVPLRRIATAGDSGNDTDMLTGTTAGIVVANHAPEIEHLKQSGNRIFFASRTHAGGILEGLQHYGWLPQPPATAPQAARAG